MRLACCLFAILAVPAASRQPAARIEASVAGHSFIVKGVYLNGLGPLSMLVDTGNVTSLIRPAVARRLNLDPVAFVEQATVAGVRRLPVAVVEEVRVAGAVDQALEIVLGDVFQAGVDGVLGANWLVRHDYVLDYRARSFALDSPPAATGLRVPLRSIDGRPVVVASIDGRARELVLDSGASAVVLYEKPVPIGESVQLVSNGGAVPAQRFTALLSLPDGHRQIVDAVRLDVHGLGPSLLPAVAFASVLVSNRHGFVELKTW